MPDDFIKKFMLKFSESISFKNNGKQLNADGVLRLEIDGLLVSYMKSLEVYFESQENPNANVIRLKFEE